MIKPFYIEISQAELDDLAVRLGRARWPDELPGVGWDHGIPLGRVRELVDYWRTGYHWRQHEAELNAYPQFTTEIDGQNIHFLHVRSPGPDALPLILTHGWPGSIVEFLDVIGPLSEKFHLVIPSIPGFGFSGPTHNRGWDIHRIARAWAELMRRLGYDRYGAQGGDWGSGISLALGAADPGHVAGIHVNFLSSPPAGYTEDGLPAEDLARLQQAKRFRTQPSAHRLLQSTRPQTLAYALTDSPVGQLAWIAEKFDEWADPRSEIAVDRMLTNVAIYWLTGTAGSSARLHRENAGPPPTCTPPLGVAVFPHEVVLPVRAVVEQAYTVTHWTEFDRGGHFAALEAPDLLAADVRSFFADLQ
jgi:pimeloyl-ACP methyl ester carboxylesterase